MKSSRQSQSGAALALTAFVLLLTAILLGWYSVSATNSLDQGTTTFDLWEVHTTTYLGGPASSYPVPSSYSDAHLSQTGILYAAASILMVVALAASAFAGFAYVKGQRSRIRRWVVVPIALAAILATTAPILIAVEQPMAVCADAKNFSPPLGAPPNGVNGSAPGCTWEFYNGTWWNPGGGSGPGSTFVGHSSAGAGSESWGPGQGWVLALVAAAVLWIAVVIEAKRLRAHSREAPRTSPPVQS
jgi:hypothetical protein